MLPAKAPRQESGGSQFSMFSKPECRAIGLAVEKALKPLESQLGVFFKYAGGVFDPEGNDFKLKVQVTKPDANGARVDQAVEDFKRFSVLHDVPADALGKTITLGTKTYKIAGMRKNARSKPFLIERDGKKYIASGEEVRNCLIREQIIPVPRSAVG